jgi:ferredoxin-NADP reductase
MRDHDFHRVRIHRVVDETPDARSFVLDVPDDFAYEAGQFCTFRVPADGPQLRCYSMSSTPGVDGDFQVTVKRVPGGVVSNWMLDRLAEGDEVEVTYPAGVFCLPEGGSDVIAFAGGSGITPVFSLVKAAVATTGRRVRLLYANKDREHTIFRAELDALMAEHPDRLEVVHHLDVDDGFVDAGTIRPWAGEGDFFVCGPTPFMDIVEGALLEQGVDPERIHIERFTTPPIDEPVTAEVDDLTVTVELGGRKESASHHPGTTVLQMARQVGLSAPSSCESGSCATCMAMLVEGEVTMRVNNALTPEEVAEGWILTCQSVPATSVHVVYEGT